VLWRELNGSRLKSHSAADAAEIREVAERLEQMRRLSAMFPT
jgi:hypothetical protein